MYNTHDPTLYDTTFYDIELRLFRSFTTGGYQIALRTWLDDEVSQELEPPPKLIVAAPEKINPRSYGEILYKWLFQGRIGQALERARWSVSSRSSFSPISSEGGMRFYLALAEDLPPELARVRWEALHVPDGYLPFSMSTAFARLLRVRARRIEPLAPQPVRMLQILASPHDLGAMGLPNLDPALLSFTDSAQKQPWAQSVDVLSLGPLATPDEVRVGVLQGFHIVCLIAHMVSDEKETRLVLSDAGGGAYVASEDEWVNTLAPPEGPVPYLVYLVIPPLDFANRDALVGSQQIHRAVRHLLSSGVRFVVTMQGPLEPRAVEMWYQSFFRSLLQTGLVDVAVASARFDLLTPDQPDSWDWAYPVLSVRTHGGSLVTAL